MRPMASKFCGFTARPERVLLPNIPCASLFRALTTGIKGKTFLSAKIIEDLKRTSSVPVAFFFAVHENTDKRQPISILRSWILQLASQRVGAFDELCKLRESAQDIGRGPTESELWSIFKSIITRVGRCFLVVDGYDETSTGLDQRRSHSTSSREVFLKELLNITGTTQARIALISRDEVDIRRVLETQSSVSPLIRVDVYGICQEDTAQDIVAFSQKVVGERLSDSGGDVVLNDQISKTLSDRSEAMFLWVRLAAAGLNPGRSSAQLTRDLSEIPGGLEAAYFRDQQKILALNSKERRRAIEILRWTLYAFRPLSVWELTEALLIDSENHKLDKKNYPESIDLEFVKFQILRLCGSMVEVKQEKVSEDIGDFVVRLTHFSVKEFLLGHGETEVGKQLSEAESHRILSGSCLSYLIMDELDHNAEIIRVRRPDTMNLTILYKFKFMKYSNSHWDLHLEAYENLAPNYPVGITAIQLLLSNSIKLGVLYNFRYSSFAWVIRGSGRWSPNHTVPWSFPHEIESDENTPLQSAVRFGVPIFLRYVLARSTTYSTAAGHAAFKLAVRLHRSVKILTLIWDHFDKGNPNWKKEFGDCTQVLTDASAWTRSVHQNQYSGLTCRFNEGAISFLIDRIGADITVNIQPLLSCINPTIKKAARPSWSYIEFLLKSGLSPNSTFSGVTLLQFACRVRKQRTGTVIYKEMRFKYYRLARELLELGACVNCPYTPPLDLLAVEELLARKKFRVPIPWNTYYLVADVFVIMVIHSSEKPSF